MARGHGHAVGQRRTERPRKQSGFPRRGIRKQDAADGPAQGRTGGPRHAKPDGRKNGRFVIRMRRGAAGAWPRKALKGRGKHPAAAGPRGPWVAWRPAAGQGVRAAVAAGHSVVWNSATDATIRNVCFFQEFRSATAGPLATAARGGRRPRCGQTRERRGVRNAGASAASRAVGRDPG